MTAASAQLLTFEQIVASLEQETCAHPDDRLVCRVYAPRCFEFFCGVCGKGKLAPSKRCPSCALPLVQSKLGPGITVLRCGDCETETLEVRGGLT